MNKEERKEVAVIGVGNIGTAYLHYNFVRNNNTKIIMGFDADPNKIGTEIDNIPIYDIDDLDDKLGDVQVAILTVPVTEAQQITDQLVKKGIAGILNFTPARITVPENVRVHHIDLAIELQSLAYFLKHYPLDLV